MEVNKVLLGQTKTGQTLEVGDAWQGVGWNLISSLFLFKSYVCHVLSYFALPLSPEILQCPFLRS